MKLPLRFRILHLLGVEQKALIPEEIMEKLKDEYGNERQFRKNAIIGHLQSMKAVGLVQTTEVYLTDAGELVERFEITDYGRDRLKYLPAQWKVS
ncbi:helix-turn-helix transcriptional regulator [Carboxydothermus ferrireducens]|uniref:DNA-binding PadR family transcriptional regulator n=1 Tax=Carboxydothermus ferrireducens DSM 11255 TaxID=1119529 RepID=A0ABX2RBX1_9THEO|nr:helix-turn-helix transcriptional regulator [Carboxydothermus ferrireducens]NYE58515.1 DNA-binding PadR family transcriptional regulator [Carboxydothermus ferrireducens DSM 11255]